MCLDIKGMVIAQISKGVVSRKKIRKNVMSLVISSYNRIVCEELRNLEKSGFIERVTVPSPEVVNHYRIAKEEK